MSFLTKIEDLSGKVGRAFQPAVLLVIRLFWGWQFVLTGTGKLRHLEKTASYFQSLNIPMPKLNALMAASTESLGGLLLILGLFTRFATPALICVMCVAFATADREAVNVIFSDPDKFTGADPFLFLYASVLIFAFGPGKVSLDALVRKKT